MAYQIPAFNTPNRQPTDINPLDAELASDPQAAAVWRSVRGDMTTLAGLFDQITTLDNNLFVQVSRINSDERLNEGTKQREETALRNSALEQIAGFITQAQAARERILAVVNAQLDPSAFVEGSNAQQTLVYIERTRDAWNRAKMVLDSVDRSVSGSVWQRALRLAQEAAERNDTFTMSALRQNLEAYLESISQKMPRGQIVSQLNVAMAPAASPAMRAAMVIQQTLEAGYQNLQACLLGAQRFAKDKNFMRVSGMPGWPNQPDVTI